MNAASAWTIFHAILEKVKTTCVSNLEQGSIFCKIQIFKSTFLPSRLCKMMFYVVEESVFLYLGIFLWTIDSDTVLEDFNLQVHTSIIQSHFYKFHSYIISIEVIFCCMSFLLLFVFTFWKKKLGFPFIFDILMLI